MPRPRQQKNIVPMLPSFLLNVLRADAKLYIQLFPIGRKSPGQESVFVVVYFYGKLFLQHLFVVRLLRLPDLSKWWDQRKLEDGNYISISIYYRWSVRAIWILWRFTNVAFFFFVIFMHCPVILRSTGFNVSRQMRTRNIIKLLSLWIALSEY